MNDLPIFLTTTEVIELGVNPELLDPAGTYFASRDGTKKLVGEPLYRSKDALRYATS